MKGLVLALLGGKGIELKAGAEPDVFGPNG